MSDYSLSLRKLSDHALALVRQIEESEGELNPFLEHELSCSEKQLTTKLDSYAALMERLELESELIGRRIKELGLLKKRHDGALERLEGNIKHCMLSLDKTEMSGEFSSFKLGRAGGIDKLTFDEKVLPESYLKEVKTLVPDKELIRLAMDGGAEIPGASLTRSFVLKRKTLAGRLK